MYIQCPRCNTVRLYTGKSKNRVVCPICNLANKIEKYTILSRKEAIPFLIIQYYKEIKLIGSLIIELDKELISTGNKGS